MIAEYFAASPSLTNDTVPMRIALAGAGSSGDRLREQAIALRKPASATPK
jgi:hypothetical protein